MILCLFCVRHFLFWSVATPTYRTIGLIFRAIDGYLTICCNVLSRVTNCTAASVYIDQLYLDEFDVCFLYDDLQNLNR